MGCSSSSSADAGATSKKGTVTFAYFNTRGGCRGNGTRYLLAYAKVPHVDKQFDLNNLDEWKKVKAQRDASDFPGINLPYIEDGNFKLSEALAVQRYICSKWCPALLGDTPEKRAKVY